MVLTKKPRIELKSPAQLAKMRRAGLLLNQIHDALQAALKPGITTKDLDLISHQMINDNHAKSNFLGYHGFPATICVSVNEEIVHGIPGPRVLEAGDVVSIDAGCIVDGWHADAARTHIVGKAISPQDEELLAVTQQALWDGIAAMATAKRVGEIGAAIEDSVYDAVGEELAHLEDFGGHGIGSQMHQPPEVMNYRVNERGVRLKTGMVLAIEPMLVQGSADYEILPDEWTVVAINGGRAAHFEHSVALCEDGIFVLTAADGGAAELAKRGVKIAKEPSE